MRRALTIAGWLLGTLALAATLLRFVALDRSPPGLYIDEAAIAWQVACVRETGADLFGRRLPLFSPVLGGGFVTPGYLYAGAAWTAVFDGPHALRALSALFGALTVAGVYLLALALWSDRRAALFAALCAALSPWGFLASRIGWDPPLAPCLLVAALWLQLRHSARPRLDGMLAGVLAAGACYSYPPLRVQAPLVLALAAAFTWVHRPERRAVLPPLAASAATLLLPLAALTLDGTLQGRFNALSVWNPDYLARQGGGSLPLVLRLVAENLALNLSPGYLFLHGDANLRHSTRAAGQWGWLEIAGLLAALLLLARGKLLQRAGEGWILLGLAGCYLAGLLPAAMTHEGNPHALRSLGAQPFAALASGFALARAAAWRGELAAATAVLAVAFSVYWFWDFFARYPTRAQAWFQTPQQAVEDVRRAASGAGLAAAPCWDAFTATSAR